MKDEEAEIVDIISYFEDLGYYGYEESQEAQGDDRAIEAF